MVLIPTSRWSLTTCFTASSSTDFKLRGIRWETSISLRFSKRVLGRRSEPTCSARKGGLVREWCMVYKSSEGGQKPKTGYRGLSLPVLLIPENKSERRNGNRELW